MWSPLRACEAGQSLGLEPCFVRRCEPDNWDLRITFAARFLGSHPGASLPGRTARLRVTGASQRASPCAASTSCCHLTAGQWFSQTVTAERPRATADLAPSHPQPSRKVVVPPMLDAYVLELLETLWTFSMAKGLCIPYNLFLIFCLTISSTTHHSIQRCTACKLKSFLCMICQSILYRHYVSIVGPFSFLINNLWLASIG